MDSILALEGTGIATAAQNLLETDGVGSVTLSIPGIDGAVVVVTKENISEKISELESLFIVLAGSTNATAKDIIKAIHPHPTMSEGIMEAAAAVHGEAIHM